jgi:hypothetical protein
MNTTRRALNVTIALFVAPAWSGAALAAPNEHGHHHHHHNGPQLLGEKLKANGRHQIDRKGHHTVSVDVKDGKVAAFHVHHDTKGDVAVKKYKTSTKMAGADGYRQVVYLVAQAQDLGTVYIGYSYEDDNGDEQIYWFPYDMILDGDTGAIDYVPVED